MEGIYPLRVRCCRVLVGEDIIRYTVDIERGVLDAVCVAPGDATEMGVLAVNGVIGRVVKTTYDVELNAGGRIDEKVGDRSTVWNEIGADIRPIDGVFSIGIRPFGTIIVISAGESWPAVDLGARKSSRCAERCDEE